MGVFTRECISTEEEFKADGCGLTLHDITNALAIWWAMNSESGRKISVAESALAFNTTPDIIRDALGKHPYATISNDNDLDPKNQIIDIDGE